jgi:hypothetical protein
MRHIGGLPLLLGVLFILACKPPETPEGVADLADRADADLRPGPDLALPPLGTDVLIYYGNGGVPPGMLSAGLMRYNRLTEALAGHTVSHIGTWPASLDAFALIVLVFPGATTMGSGLDSVQHAQIASWVDRGGRLVVQADRGSQSGTVDFGAGNRASEALVSALGASITIVGDYYSVFPVALNPADPLAANVGGMLSCGGPTSLSFTAGGALRRVDAAPQPTIAAFTRGKGEVVLLGDSQCLDDANSHGAELATFAKNLVTPRP